MAEKLYWHTCPGCGTLSRISEQHYRGKKQIVCDCGSTVQKDLSVKAPEQPRWIPEWKPGRQ